MIPDRREPAELASIDLESTLSNLKSPTYIKIYILNLHENHQLRDIIDEEPQLTTDSMSIGEKIENYGLF